MARSDWTKDNGSNEYYERYRRRDGMAVSCSLDIPPGDDWRVFREKPFAYLAKRLTSAEAAMDYADKRWPNNVPNAEPPPPVTEPTAAVQPQATAEMKQG